MYIARQALEEAGIQIVENEYGISIQGTAPMPKRVHRAVTEICNSLGYTPQEADQLMVHVVDVPLLRKLQSISTI